ncbi:hypothetical protein [Psychrosphaera algicola]|uniref:Rhamnogalacturonan acetylesterase n=1 Tax=Psychrosphaera algicola TaxID=3023714 RepID=A0ABT5FID9_9GAMM|nr:hypothetical protein [Psychrosphaera sp. G1-22]MDC2890962.1 hypothetical protein [Psychrosphaera sp. G1-22]
MKIICRLSDYVFIQFGHNDQSTHKTDRYTTPAQYEANIRNMIQITQQKAETSS